jgi:T3SS negative regulator,GrlR
MRVYFVAAGLETVASPHWGAVIVVRENPAGRGVRSVADSTGSEIDTDLRVRDGLYNLTIEMSGPKRGHATGIVVLRDGVILGGDSFFYYTGSYTFSRGKWRGEMIVNQHTEAPGLNLVFGGREVSCGFTGTYSAGAADIDGTALVGSYSIAFRAHLTLRVPTEG